MKAEHSRRPLEGILVSKAHQMDIMDLPPRCWSPHHPPRHLHLPPHPPTVSVTRQHHTEDNQEQTMLSEWKKRVGMMSCTELWSSTDFPTSEMDCIYKFQSFSKILILFAHCEASL